MGQAKDKAEHSELIINLRVIIWDLAVQERLLQSNAVRCDRVSCYGWDVLTAPGQQSLTALREGITTAEPWTLKQFESGASPKWPAYTPKKLLWCPKVSFHTQKPSCTKNKSPDIRRAWARSRSGGKPIRSWVTLERCGYFAWPRLRLLTRAKTLPYSAGYQQQN